MACHKRLPLWYGGERTLIEEGGDATPRRPPNRRQWTRPVLTELRVSGRTNTGTEPSIRYCEGVCPTTIYPKIQGYRAPTSAEPTDGSNPEC